MFYETKLEFHQLKLSLPSFRLHQTQERVSEVGLSKECDEKC